MKNKAFTLIELLAVIVILAVILVVAIPYILNSISVAKKGAFDSDAKLVIDAMEKRKLADETFDPKTIDVTTITTILGLSSANYASIETTLEDDNINIVIVGKNKWAGLTAYGTYKEMAVVNSKDYDATAPVITLIGSNPLNLDQGVAYTDPGVSATDNRDGNVTNRVVKSGTVDINTIGTYTITYTVTDNSDNTSTATRTVNVTGNYIVSEGVNKPRLSPGMTAVKWNGTLWEAVADPNSDTSWYDYSNKQWANAKTEDGSMWVWIPRYIYKISSEWHTATAGTIDIQFTKDTDDNWNSAVIGNIDVGTTSNASNNKWTNHPAFTFGTTELTGIWVAKFEASVSNTSDTCYTSPNETNCDKTALAPKIVPNVKSWRYIQIGNAFTNIRNMETDNTYGWGTSGNGIDTHLTKNTEWGAVAYLSKSSYGKNAEITINNNGNYYTGGGTSDAYVTNVAQSTTGNIYGIYDMSGGSYEYTAAYVNNANPASFGNSIYTANSKYKDVYTITTDDQATNYSNAINQKGDAVYEISSSYTGSNSWFGDYSIMTYSSGPWFIRGGYYGNSTDAGIFSFYYTNGYAGGPIGFRPVLLISSGL